MEKVILFDLDGTVIDSTDAIVETFLYSFEKKNFNFMGTKNDIKSLIGYTLEDMYKGLGIREEDVNDFVKRYKERYKEISVEQTFLLPKAKDAILEAHSFARLGVVTTKTTLYTIPILKNMNIYSYFDVLIGRQEVINPKPHPEPIIKAMNMMEVDLKTHAIFMIGDTKLDLIAANAAGIQAIGVYSGYDTKQELLKYTDLVFATVYDAVMWIKKL